MSKNQTKFSRLEAPYESECISEWSSTNYSSFTGDKSWTYTEEVPILSFASRGTSSFCCCFRGRGGEVDTWNSKYENCSNEKYAFFFESNASECAFFRQSGFSDSFKSYKIKKKSLPAMQASVHSLVYLDSRILKSYKIQKKSMPAMQASVPSFLNLDGLRLLLPPGCSCFWEQILF